MKISTIVAFRAVNFLVEYFGLKWNSESLRIMSGEMEPAPGSQSGDPAMVATWKELWGNQSVGSEQEATSVAVSFLEREGGWAEGDDAHERLALGLSSASEDTDGEISLAWRYCLDKARRYSDPNAWS